MKIYIDFSVLVKTGESLGHVTGEVECSTEPKLGSQFELPGHADLDNEVGMPSSIEIEHIHNPGHVALESVTLDKAYSLEMMDQVVEKQMGLIWNPHGLL